jgi:hypothetical protein
MMSLDSALQEAFKAHVPRELPSEEMQPFGDASEDEDAVEGNKTPTKCELADHLSRETGETHPKEVRKDCKIHHHNPNKLSLSPM